MRTERIWIYKLKLWLWDTYFIYTALLVIKHILKTQKWAPGFTEPGATTRLLTNTIEKYLHFYKLQTYFIYTALLVITHIL